MIKCTKCSQSKSKSQHGLCAICLLPEVVKRNGKVKALAIDHNKTTKKLRGLLCQKCNQAFGLLQEDITILKSMIDYALYYEPEQNNQPKENNEIL